MLNKKHIKYLSKSMKLFLCIMLSALAAIMIIFLFKETWLLVTIILTEENSHGSYKAIETIILWFLYFEFIALIAKYFESNLHFPLRYFIYIGITAITRLIIINHDKSVDTLIYSLAILALLVALYIANTQLLKRT